MKFIVSSTALSSHLQAISRVINSKNALPILDCFLFELEDGTLSVTVSDSETTMVTTVEVNESDTNGRFAVVAKTLLDALKEIVRYIIQNLNTRKYMKFIVSSTALSSHLQAISRVINSKNALPILDCFLFELEDGTLSVTVSDSETTMVTTVEVNESDTNGRFAVVAKTLLDALKEIPEQPLTFEINPDNYEITVQYQNGKYSLMGQNADEFPQSATLGDNAVRVEMEASVLLGGINRSVFATADDELRPVMNGIYFDITTEDITMVASDGHKLVRCKTLAAKGNERAAFILPKKPATLLKNLLPKEQGTVTIEFDERNAVFMLESYRMVCRLIEGRYPNYNSVIPQNNPHKVTVDRQQLVGALRRVSIFSSQASSLIKLRMQENQIVISAQDIDFSTSAEETQVCQYAGAAMSIGFKSTFLIDILNNISADEVVIELADPSRAGVIIPVEQEENEDLLMLLMPMMLND